MSPVSGVTASTKLFAVVGKPVRHSLSPLMQTAAFAEEGIDACYLAFEVEPENFPEAVHGARALGFGGLNVTVPYKRDAFLLADEKDETAVVTGAANTLVPCKNGWKAYNTDVAGFLGAIKKGLSFFPSGGSAAVIGTGGAARAAVHGLLAEGIRELYISGRNMENVEALAGEMGPHTGVLKPLRLKDLPGVAKEGMLVVSATPLGLSAGAKWPFPLDALPRGMAFYDMAYAKDTTPLEDEARAAGFSAASGKLMLALQGGAAFRLWTGREPPLKAMIAALNGDAKTMNDREA